MPRQPPSLPPGQDLLDDVYFRSMQSAPPPLIDRLQSIRDASDQLPRAVPLGLAITLLSLAILADWPPLGARIALPLYYLIPVCILAWFVGWRPVLSATIIAAVASFSGVLLANRPAAFPTFLLLGRTLTFALALLIGRVLAVGRLMLDYYLLGDQLRALIVPIRIGDRLVSIPTRDTDIRELERDLDPEDIPLLIRPGTAFGSGSHPTTQMCLLLLEEYLEPGQLVFDFGSGSGILSIAAAKLGARRVYAVDVAAEAEGVIHQNIQLNGLDDVIQFRRGSWPAFLDVPAEDGWHAARDSSTGPAETGSVRADLLLGNILTSIIVEALRQGLTRCVAPGGKLILSGVLVDHRDRVRKALEEAGLAIVEWREMREWLAVVASRTG